MIVRLARLFSRRQRLHFTCFTLLEAVQFKVRKGGWFDGSHPFIFNGEKADDGSDKFYAPQFMLENYERYKYLLQVPDSDGK